MLYKESIWIGGIVKEFLPDRATALNIGSSTSEFRKHDQSYIQENIFDLLDKKGCKTIHVDMKQDPGVDEVGDVTNKDFLNKLRTYDPEVIICSNILEHLTERKVFCDSLSALLPKGGFLIVTVPYEYPYHADPIDTMYRPTIQQLESEFKGLKTVKAEIVKCGTLLDFHISRLNGIQKAKRKAITYIKSFLYSYFKVSNFEKSKEKLQVVSATCVLLSK